MGGGAYFPLVCTVSQGLHVVLDVIRKRRGEESADEVGGRKEGDRKGEKEEGESRDEGK